jgi:hypothetical protein
MEENLRYPIGKFKAPIAYTSDYLSESVQSITDFPLFLNKAVSQLNDAQLDTPYREGGWTIRQVIHHCADSHMNCFIRLKWTLTENKPTIKYYHEDRWGEMIDNTNMPIGPTLLLLEGLHYRLAYLMKNLSESDLEKSFLHPEHNTSFQIKEIIGIYAWHGLHHLAHITALIKRMGW